jgi:hypothetical protein
MGKARDPNQAEFAFEGDPDGDARGKTPKRKRKVGPVAAPGAWHNCAANLHHLCAVKVLVNATMTWARCVCPCHPKDVT